MLTTLLTLGKIVALIIGCLLLLAVLVILTLTYWYQKYWPQDRDR